MTAFNIVRFKVKPGRERDFVDAHRGTEQPFPGFVRGSLVTTGDRGYCFVGEWNSFEDLAAARPQLIGILDTFRDMLEDQGRGLGVTDPVSGNVVLTVQGTADAHA